MLIRVEQVHDIPVINALHEAAFPGPLEARLVTQLREAGRLRLSLVAELEGVVVGHVAFSPVTLAGTTSGWGLAPVAVLPAKQRQGIGQALIRRALIYCAQANCDFLVVLGDPGYYARRFGFSPAARWNLTDEYGGGEAFQALELTPGSIPSAGGQVRYAPEFSIFAGS